MWTSWFQIKGHATKRGNQKIFLVLLIMLCVLHPKQVILQEVPYKFKITYNNLAEQCSLSISNKFVVKNLSSLFLLDHILKCNHAEIIQIVSNTLARQTFKCLTLREVLKNFYEASCFINAHIMGKALNIILLMKFFLKPCNIHDQTTLPHLGRCLLSISVTSLNYRIYCMCFIALFPPHPDLKYPLVTGKKDEYRVFMQLFNMTGA